MDKKEYGDNIFKLLQYCDRRKGIPDLHSFVADIKNGTVFVELREDGVFIESYVYDENSEESKTQWCGTVIAAANRLEMLKINLESVKI